MALPLALARTTFLVVPTASGLWRGLADPPGLLRIAFAVVAGTAVAFFADRLPRGAARPLLLGLLAAAPLVPLATGHAVILAAFAAPLLRIVMCAALAAALACVARARGWSLSPAAWGVAAFVFYVAVGTCLPGPAGPQGDEPHYLTMAESLWSDGDVDLHDELEARAYAPFYAGTLAPHTSPSLQRLSAMVR